MNIRKLKDGTPVPELDEAQTLVVKTKCPAKWLLIDRETGEAYVPYDTKGSMQWKKLFNAEWSVDA
jgi:hypothetical protein